MALTRRTLLSTGMGVGMTAGLPSLGLGAQSELTIGTWGGDYGRLLKSLIDDPVMQPLGVSVSQLVGTQDVRRAKLLAEKRARRGSMDVVCLDDTDTSVMASQQLLTELSEANLPRFRDLLPGLRTHYSVPQIFTAYGILYNPTFVPTAPRHFADIWDPKYRGRIGLVDFGYLNYVAVAAMVGGGSFSNYEPAKAKLRELKALAPKIYPSVEALGAAFKSEEVWIAPNMMSRGYMWRKSGMSIRYAQPEGDSFPLSFHCSIPRNAGNTADALRYLNAALDPASQIGFAAKLGYLPTVTTARLPAELAAELSLSDAERARLKPLNYGYVATQLPAFQEFWNREFKA